MSAPASLSRTEIANHARDLALAYRRLYYAAERWTDARGAAAAGVGEDGWQGIVAELLEGPDGASLMTANVSARVLEAWADTVLAGGGSQP